MIVAFVVLAGGCGGAEHSPAPDALPTARDGNFVLYVSNQSFELPEVDIRVEIDGRPAVDDEFRSKTSTTGSSSDSGWGRAGTR